MTEIINTNYEKFMKLIPEDKKIIKVMTDIVKDKAINNILDFKKQKDSKGYEYTVIKEKSKLYESQPWFYNKDYDLYEDNFSIHPYQFYDLSTATLMALYQCGSINSYLTTRDVKLLFVNQSFIKKVIDNIIDPLLKSDKITHKDYYRYVKIYLKTEYNLATSSEIKKTEIIRSSDIKGDSWTRYFLVYTSRTLGYNGLLFLDNNGLYNKVSNSVKIILNKKKFFTRNTESKYDWLNWGVENYILPMGTFDLNIKYYLYRNMGFKVYDFYKESLQVSIKVTEEYDFGTLNINNLISINKLFDKDRCMRELIIFIKEHKLKFICLQDIKYKDTATFNKFIEAEGMYTSVGDFEEKYFTDNDLCNIIVSTSNIIILNNELLPGNKEHFILFKHPNYRKKIFLNTKLIEGIDNATLRLRQLEKIKNIKTDYIIGNLNVIKGTLEFNELNSMGYALNSEQVYGTNIDNIQTDYILSKLPKILKSVVPLNYKYSDHKALIGKI